MIVNSNIKISWIVVIVLISSIGTSARAQSSVTLYGVTDAGIQFASKTANSTGQNAGPAHALTDGGNGASLIGIVGTEDLGGGMKAKFDLEGGISVANGSYNSSSGSFFGRQAWVGLFGRFGELRLGEQNTPFFLSIYETDPRNYSSFGSAVVPYANNVAFTGGVNSNAVLFKSSTVAGFEGSMMLALGGVAGNFQAGRQWSASLKYDNGTLMVNAAIYDGNGGGAVTPVSTNVEFEGRTIGVVYRIGSVVAKASFVNYKVAGSSNNNVYGGGAEYFVTPELDLNSGVWLTSDRNQTSNHSLLVALGANYFLSKQTSLYAQVGVLNNHGAMNTGLSVTDVSLLNEVRGTTIGANTGVRHTF
ncbi:porin [Paraburkholderia agricolaris]|uniref:Porin n=1 Tax=Paraburkholderia agricolaris TaxID=2152888 RepID=A0ABW8ZZE0_9BURK